MGILNWVQGKLSGKQQDKKRFNGISSSARLTSAPHDRKEEFSDWPQALLAIGTFGNNQIREDPQRNDASGSLLSLHEFPDFTIEEVTKLQKELTELLSLKPQGSNDGSGEGSNLPLNRFLNCPSSLEVDWRACVKFCEDVDNGDNGGDLSPNSKIILNKAKDILAENCNAIKKKSISFLLRKMFLCTSGFAPAPSLRDPILESRMEKLLRMILHKKIYPHNSAASSTKKYLGKKPSENMRVTDRDVDEEKGEDTGKWVKTDSEFIVLEI